MFRFALILCTALLLCGCGKPRPPAPTPAGPRVASISPAIGVMLADLHYDNLCVGRDGHDIALSPSLPVVGTQNRIDYEALIAANPTHVFTQWGSRDLPSKLSSLAASNHWRLIDSRLLTLEDIRETTVQVDEELCRALSVPPPSQACRGLLDRMDRAWGRRNERFASIGKVLLLAEPSPPAAFGPGSCHYQLLERLGATPAITDGAAYINMNLEDIVQLAPDAIILIRPRGASSPPTDPAAPTAGGSPFGSIAKLDIPAVRNHRLAHIDDPLGFIPSTSMIRVAQELSEVLDGWAKE